MRELELSRVAERVKWENFKSLTYCNRVQLYSISRPFEKIQTCNPGIQTLEKKTKTNTKSKKCNGKCKERVAFLTFALHYFQKKTTKKQQKRTTLFAVCLLCFLFFVCFCICFFVRFFLRFPIAVFLHLLGDLALQMLFSNDIL